MTDNKKRAGVYKSLNVKTSDFLPSVFQTNVNKRWLDSTLDQMVSKGDLQSLEGYIGKISGKCATSQDPYLSLKNKTALSPAIVTRNPDGTIDNKVLFTDIESANRNNFSEYNYNSAYASAIYGYHPPIDVDKFVNFNNYYWVEELPVYTAINNNDTSPVDNPVQDCVGAELYKLIDDNNEFLIDNNMLIKFQGTGWNSAIAGNTYIITGVGDEIQPYLYSNELGRKFYTGASKADMIVRGAWDKTRYTTVLPNKNDSYWQAGSRTPESVLQAYNTDTSESKLPIFEGFVFSNFSSNPEKFTVNELVKFSGDWDIQETERAKIYYTRINDSGELELLEVIGAEINNNVISTFVNLQTISEYPEISRLLDGWDKENWDADINDLIIKDYHVIAKNDGNQTAWSRNNNWVHVNTINKLNDLIIGGVDTYDLISQKRNAQRPIIEFLPYMVLWNYASEQSNRSWIGMVDFILDVNDTEYVLNNDGQGSLSYNADNLPVPVGSSVILYTPEASEEYQFIFQMQASGQLTPIIFPGNTQPLNLLDNTAYVVNAVQDSVSDWESSDVYFKDGKWQRGQQKTRANQPPLFQLYYYDNTPLQNISGSTFAGSKVFGYKTGTGAKDPELGIALSYKDSATGAEYEFENFILTEKVTESFTSSTDNRISHFWNLPGFYFFKIKNLLKTVYDKNEIAAGTKQQHVYEITESQDLTIPFGHSNWRFEKEALLYVYGGSPKISEIVGKGVYLNKDRNILTGNNQTVTLHDLVHYNDIRITTANGYDLENPPAGVTMPDITIVRTPNSIQLVIGDVGTTTVNVNFDPDFLERDNADVKIYINPDNDSIYHTVSINGTPLTHNQYQILENQIIIPQELLSVGDLVDFEYYSNSAISDEYTSLPDNLENNATNEIMNTFTISETLDHWTSIISSQPGITGNAFGNNNYNEIARINNLGGKIEIHADISAMHDLNYGNNALDITGALIAQGADWDAFAERFKNQVKRIYATKTYTSVFDIVVDALESVVLNRKGSELYRDSNMLFGHKHNLEKLEITENSNILYSKYMFNGDDNIRDHVYVYLTDDRDQNGKFIQRLLTKDVDYTIVGNQITLLTDTYAHTTLGDLPYLTVSYHHMDEQCFVPPSPVKLKLQRAYQPQIVANHLITHDGKMIDLGTKNELEDVSSENFDPVNAARYDLEKRIYAGLVSVDKMYGDKIDAIVNNYASAYDYLPAQHKETWYSLELVDQYIEKFFQKWLTEKNITDISPENYYDNQDPTTWNYSSILVEEHFAGNRLPGHWQGAYTVLFGTTTPHITPWHMLGHTFKPTWWDEHYSWTDVTKRQQLLTALQTGIVGRYFSDDEDKINYQDPAYARYYWDWNTKCPVDVNGELVSPELILGLPSELNRSQPFVFGDWGPVEQTWRNSAQGYMALVDAVVKLNPARAWTDFFQPGNKLTNRYLSEDINLYTKYFPVVDQYPVPGQVYNSVIKSVSFTNTQDKFDRESSSIRIANGNGTIEAKTAISYNPNYGYTDQGRDYRYITGVSIISRGRGYTGTPSVLTSFTSEENQNSDISVILQEVSHVASGISQAQYNHTIRKQIAVDLAQVYSTLDIRLAQPLSGFSSKHLLDMYLDSSLYGAYRLDDGDYTIEMHENYPTDFVNASQITITKTSTGYVVNGLSSNAQEFRFYEPNLANNNTSTVGVGNTKVRKYKSFSSTPSVVQYGTKFAKIQDTYNFIRGYWHYLELNGYKFQVSGDAQALSYVQWAIAADVDSDVTLSFGSSVEFTPVFGSAVEYNNFRYNKNDILDANGVKIGTENLSIDRIDGTVSIKTKDGKDLGSVASAVVSYDHVLVFNNTTSRGLLFNNLSKSLRYDRVYVSGQKTVDWTGEKKALGYLVSEDHITQNFDSSVAAVEDYYRTDVKEFNPGLTKAKDLSIGNIDREWISSLGLDKNTVTKFFQGVIKEAGTHGAIDKIARTDLLDHGTTQIQVSEQFMFNQGYFGENKLDNHIEVQLAETDITKNPQIIKFGNTDVENVIAYPSGSKRIVHPGNPVFHSEDYQTSSKVLLTAGEPLETETKYRTLTVEQMPEVFDSKETYAQIPTWQSNVSYKKGDQVRREGKLYQCLVESTGILVVDSGITATGTVTNPVFAHGTVANIAGTSTLFENNATVYNPIEALGTVTDPELSPNETLVIDNRPITFTKTTQRTIVIGDAIMQGNISNPAILNAEDQFATINGVTIDFNEDTPANQQQVFTGSGTDITPAPVTEQFVGVVAQATYTIATGLSSDTYSINSVTIDGQPSTDWTLNGQDITFNTPIFVGGENIEVNLVHDALIVLEDTFLVTVEQLGTLWSVSDVLVEGVPATQYTVIGQDIIFNLGHEPGDGDNVTAIIKHIPASLTMPDIIDKINSKNITGVTASESTDGFSRLVLSMTTTDPLATLTLGPSVTNNLLGFDVSGVTARPPSEIIIVNDDLNASEVASQINSANISGVTASVVSQKLLLTSTNTALEMSGTALGVLGLLENYTATTSSVPTFTTMIQAVQEINNTLTNADISDVSVVIDNNRIKITSSNNTLDFGDTEFNAVAGLPVGEVVSTNTEIENVFDLSEWDDITHQDTALFATWVADDSAYEVNDVNNVQTKFYGWNVFQGQTRKDGEERAKALYTKSTDGSDCGICAGTATSDGNDAEVTTDEDHGLQIGDYVMLLNTTTTPSIDGIHKVTQLGVGQNANRIFYIDRFIEECGNAVSVIPLRTMRFQTAEDLQTATDDTINWNNQPGNLAWINYDAEQTRQTQVYKFTNSNWNIERTTEQRVTNDDILNAVIYDADKNQTVTEFEVFDPIRGIIPGVADRELSYKTTYDPATYSVTTDEYYTVDQDDCWADAQVGERWWDTSKTLYYDYKQGSLSYRAEHWGKQFDGSEIVVWEWTKSTIAPDDYAKTVVEGSDIEMFGELATGVPYSIFDPIANETHYYYTQTQEWDSAKGKYVDVYYFWVKDKTTITNPDHILTTKTLAEIIDNPTSNGIGWVAAIDTDSVIISNAAYYLNDTSTVLQINKKISGNAHNNWMLLAKDRDVIPEYWYIGMRNNLAGMDAEDQKLPDLQLNTLNRYGDDRTIRQSWFDDLRDARYNTVQILNSLIKDVNLVEDLKDTWSRTLGRLDVTGKPILPVDMWKYTAYESKLYNNFLQPTININSTAELNDIDTSLHTVASLEIIDPVTDVDKSETYYYVDGVWELTKKNNATIEFNPVKLSLTHGFDTSPWDMVSWDNTFITEYWRLIVDACRYDLFTGSRTHKFNQLFFGVVEYTLSKMQQVNWVHKSTYVTLHVERDIDVSARKYRRDQLNEILGYINTVKPFHTKISNKFDTHTVDEFVELQLEEANFKNITVDISLLGQNFVGTIVDSNFAERELVYPSNGSNTYIFGENIRVEELKWGLARVYVGDQLMQENTDYVVDVDNVIFDIIPQQQVTLVFAPYSDSEIDGGSFTQTDYQVEYDFDQLFNPYNYTDSTSLERNEYQSTMVDLRPVEHLSIKVQTNEDNSTKTANTRTFVYVQDRNENVGVYALVEGSDTTLTADVALDSTIIEVASGSNFAENGFAYVGNEIIKFDRSGNTLYIIDRSLNGSFAGTHLTGTKIIDVTNAVISTVNNKASGQTRFNQPGSTLLQSSDAIAASEILLAGTGLEI